MARARSSSTVPVGDVQSAILHYVQRGRLAKATCPETGILVPECSCRRCNREQARLYGPASLPKGAA